MKPEIANIFDMTMQKEVSSLLENLGGMTDIIETNFSQIKDILEKHKNDVIQAITKEKNKEISELKDDIKSKDTEIKNLRQKEGELKGKEEMVASLNLRINQLQNQVEALSLRDCHNQENQFKAIVEKLTA